MHNPKLYYIFTESLHITKPLRSSLQQVCKLQVVYVCVTLFIIHVDLCKHNGDPTIYK